MSKKTQWWIVCNQCGSVSAPFGSRSAAESYLNRKNREHYDHDRVPHDNNWKLSVKSDGDTR